MKLENSFPIFNMKCNILFKSLTIFKFTGFEFIRKNIINNIYNNIDNMPNLINFKFECNINEDINEDFYNKFIIKILSLKFIKKIKISIEKQFEKKEIFTKEELNKLYPNINLDLLYDINIHHLN